MTPPQLIAGASGAATEPPYSSAISGQCATLGQRLASAQASASTTGSASSWPIPLTHSIRWSTGTERRSSAQWYGVVLVVCMESISGD